MAYSFEEKTTDMYTYLQATIDNAFQIEDTTEDENDGLSGSAYRKELTKAYLHDNRKTIWCGIGFALVLVHCIIMIVLFLKSVFALNTVYVSGNILYYIICALLPFLVWMYSTTQEYWNFHNRKIRTFLFCFFHLSLEMSSFVFRIFGTMILPFFAGLTPTAALTPSLIRSFARLTLMLSPILISVLLMTTIYKGVNHPVTKPQILSFKLDKSIDMRSSQEKEFAYDMNIVKDLKTGERRVIKEKDRFLHSVSNGTTGTGKTSSCFTCAIESDIEQICYNIEYQKKEIQKYLKENRIRMIAPMSDEDFDIDNFEPVSQKDKDLLTDLKFKAKIAGITAMAPNASFSDEVYALAKAKGLKVNRLDPTLSSNGKLKEGFRGFNPLYMKSDLSPMEKIIKQNQTAVLFADVAQAVYDASGQSDVYFAGLNKNITTTVTMLVLLTFPFDKSHKNRQPTPEDVQTILNDFDKAEPLLKILVEHYAKRDKNGNINVLHPDLGMYQPIYDVVKNDLLGEGKKQLFDQCRGLRNIINSFLQNPLVRNILCTQDSIDLDEVLDKGQITLVNYALEMGTDATVFGLFFMLSMINAVYRRPGGEIKKLPHFFYIDELPVLLHPRLEGCFSLFRQFRVGMFVAIQSLSQMEKSNSTSFLRDVLMGNCAHHFVFGRAAAREMELYEQLGGVSLQVTHMEGTKSTSILSDNPNLTFDRRDTLEKKENITGTDVRYRDFQEVTVITVDNGNAVEAFLGKVSFLPSYRRLKKKRYSVDWSIYETLPLASGAENLAHPTNTAAHANIREEVAQDTFHVQNDNVPVILFKSGADLSNDGSHEDSTDTINGSPPMDEAAQINISEDTVDTNEYIVENENSYTEERVSDSHQEEADITENEDSEDLFYLMKSTAASSSPSIVESTFKEVAATDTYTEDVITVPSETVDLPSECNTLSGNEKTSKNVSTKLYSGPTNL